MKGYLRISLYVALAMVTPIAAAAGPYAPAAEKPGTTAVFMDSEAFIAWATGYVAYIPGGEVTSTWQTPNKALGPAVGDSFDIVSLGRGGEITLSFDKPIRNAAGWDFAVFENSFSDTFLELAFVEVSSDGETFVRFNNDSLTLAAVGGYGAIDPTNINGFAGKYRQGFGTPFDLAELATRAEVLSGAVDLTAISYVRLIDVVGDGSDFDTGGQVIYDPFPTFQSAGFDLDAVGVRYETEENLPPAQPSLSFPTDGAKNVTLDLVMRSGPFSDPDVDSGDTHYRTRWQIDKDAAFSDPLLDLVSPVSLTELVLSETILAAATTYYWRVQYFDSAAAESPWSSVFSFETTTTSNDGNFNGIRDSQELPSDSDVDLDSDNVPDVDQIDPQYKVLNTVSGTGQMAVAVSNPNVIIEYIESVDPDDYPEGDNKPDDMLLGMLNLRLRVQNQGDAVAVMVYLSEPAPSGYQWFKYDATRGWQEFTAAIFDSDRRIATLDLQDGAHGDADNSINGLIIDPSGAGIGSLSSSQTSVPNSGSAGISGAGGTGCFISTLFSR